MNSRARLASGINSLAGLWLVLAPFVLGYTELQQAMWNNVVVGALVLVLAVGRVVAPGRFVPLSWINFVLGAWLIVAPFLLLYGGIDGLVDPSAATGNDIVVGLIVIAMAAWSATASQAMPADARSSPGRTRVNTSERS